MAGDLGAFLLALAFSAALISGFHYIRNSRTNRVVDLAIARGGFYAMVFAVIFAAATLMYLILGHHFEYHYVWAHSSTNLARPFLFAAFYSGQEGSFMLWTLLTALIGVFVIGYAQRYRYEPEVMSVYMVVIALLLLILVVDSPFDTIYAAFADQNLPQGFVPQNGRGLNPQLENLWITIHPPILFTGFASMTVPFVFAVAGLIRRDYQRWINIALPWTLFASMVLGFGIMLGGWWAYETLGWGGYWAWDPVENSSLIPWLICIALLHTMLVQKRTGIVERGVTKKVGGLARTNFLLSTFAFGGILYSTFLTRSGVLDDTSVHSFVAPGDFVFSVLQIILFLFLAIGIGSLIWRWKDLSLIPLNLKTWSKENWLGIGSATLLGSAFIVLVGTSWPILMPLFGNPKAKIAESFYDSTHIWIGLFIIAINGLSVLLYWKNSSREQIVKNLRVSLPVTAAVAAAIILLGGIDDVRFILLMTGAVFALVANLIQGWKFMKSTPTLGGGFVAHVGLALLFIGIIFTSGYSMTQHVQLVEGESREVFGYDVSYSGSTRIEPEKTDREKYEHTIHMVKGGSEEIVKPVIFWSDFNDREQAFLEPGIVYYPTRDIYVSPKSLESVGGYPTIVMSKGESIPFPNDSSVTVRFEKFNMSKAESEGMQGAVMSIATPDTTMFVTAYRTMDGRYGMVKIPETDLSVGFAELLANPEELSESQARIRFVADSYTPAPEKRAITVDVSIKPFISFVWGGVIIMVAGFFLSILRRRKELNVFADELDRYEVDGPEMIEESRQQLAEKESQDEFPYVEESSK